jgi:hypothetical protein
MKLLPQFQPLEFLSVNKTMTFSNIERSTCKYFFSRDLFPVTAERNKTWEQAKNSPAAR